MLRMTIRKMISFSAVVFLLFSSSAAIVSSFTFPSYLSPPLLSLLLHSLFAFRPSYSYTLLLFYSFLTSFLTFHSLHPTLHHLSSSFPFFPTPSHKDLICYVTATILWQGLHKKLFKAIYKRILYLQLPLKVSAYICIILWNTFLSSSTFHFHSVKLS